MKKLHSLTFYALVTPVIAMSSAALFAQESTDQDLDRDQRSTEYDRDTKKANPQTTKSDKSTIHEQKHDSRTAADQQNMRDQSSMKNRGYMASAPASGMQASDLIGAEVKTSADEDVGTVSNLLIDENGQIVAVVVGVGGFLGMGERDVAIGWDDVTKSGASDDLELRIDVTRDGLRSAPEYKSKEDSQ